MTSSFILPAILSPPLTGRDAITDALHRCILSFDTNSASLFDSSFLPTGSFEVNGRAMTGLSEIHATGLALIFSLDTTHLVSNVRVHMTSSDENGGGNSGEASLTATVLSQHFKGGKGMEAGEKSYMGGSLYRGDLVRDEDGLWKFRRLVAKSIWTMGDVSVVGAIPEVRE